MLNPLNLNECYKQIKQVHFCKIKVIMEFMFIYCKNTGKTKLNTTKEYYNIILKLKKCFKKYLYYYSIIINKIIINILLVSVETIIPT